MTSLVVEEEHENCSRSAVSYCEMPFADSLHGARQIPYLVLDGLSDWFFFAALQPLENVIRRVLFCRATWPSA